MKLFHRREAPPAALISLLDKDERVLSWGDAAGGTVVVATPRGLWWPEGSGNRLIGWQVVSKATWRDGALQVIEADVDDDLLLIDRLPVTAVLATPRDLPATVRKRVEANVVSSEVVAVEGGVARLVARHVPGQDGVQWWARLEQGAADTEQVRSAIRARLALLQSDWEARQN
ncbi:MAG: hypothetical protein ABI232_05575 [Jatrophihabitantaceae bacterium]